MHIPSDTRAYSDEVFGPAIFVLNESGVLGDANQAALRLCGYTQPELRSLRIDDLLKPHLREDVQNGNTTAWAMDWQEEQPTEWLLQRQNGTQVRITWSTSLMECAGQKLVLAVAEKVRPQSIPSPEVLEAIFEQSLNAIMVADDAGHYTAANQAAADMFGYTVEELLNMSVSDLPTPDLPDAKTQYNDYIAVGREVGEFEFLRSDGSVRVAGYHAVRISDNVHLSILADITHHKQIQNELSQSEARLRALFHAIPLSIYTWQQVEDDFVLTGYNNMAATVTQGKIDTLLGMRASALYHDDPQIQADLHRCYHEKMTFERVTPYRMRSTGETRILSVWCAYVPNSTVMVLTEDVTESKQREELLRKLSQVVEQSPTSIVITDATGAIEYVNPKFCELTGYTEAEALGQNPNILKSGIHPEEFYQQMWSTIRAGGTWRGEIRNKKKNGELYWEMASISGVKDENGVITHYVAVKEDITEQRRLDEQNARQERLASVGQLAAGIAHDFNNILGVITIYAQMLSRSRDCTDEMRNRADVIFQQAQHAANLVQQILDFGRRGNMEIKPLNLVPLLKEQIKLLQRTLPEHIRIQFHTTHEELLLNADPTRMQQIFTNMAINARDAMPNGGILHFDLSEVHFGKDDPLPYVGMQAGEWLKLSISDSGVGMSEEVAEHLFEPFFTTKERGRGTGLGLAQVYGIVKKHDGFILVNSKPGVGTTFDIYFPLLAPLQLPPPTVEIDFVEVDGNDQVILLVEDDVFLRRVLGELLAGWHYRIIDAADGVEAQAVLADDETSIDLVLSDVIMPHMGGIELSTYIRRRYPHLPIVLMSGHLDERDAQKFEELGLQKPLPKPLDSALLARTLAERLKRFPH